MATAAERKRNQRAKLETRVNEEPSSEWDESVCLYILQSPRWRDGAIGRAAWQRLGELRGYCESHNKR